MNIGGFLRDRDPKKSDKRKASEYQLKTALNLSLYAEAQQSFPHIQRAIEDFIRSIAWAEGQCRQIFTVQNTLDR